MPWCRAHPVESYASLRNGLIASCLARPDVMEGTRRPSKPVAIYLLCVFLLRPIRRSRSSEPGGPTRLARATATPPCTSSRA